MARGVFVRLLPECLSESRRGEGQYSGSKKAFVGRQVCQKKADKTNILLWEDWAIKEVLENWRIFVELGPFQLFFGRILLRHTAMDAMKMGRKHRFRRPLARWGAAGIVAALVAVATAAGGPPAGQKSFRRLAPGVLTVIPPRASSDSHVIRGDLLEVTRGLAEERNWTPKQAAAHTTLLERARNREFNRGNRELNTGIWCLEFAFKPPRLIDVDVPAGELKMQRKRLWYLVYRVRNTGGRRTVIMTGLGESG